MPSADHRLLSRGALAMVAGGVLFFQANAQVPASEFKRLVALDSWSADELKELEKGNPVVRPLETSDKQELATIGVVKIRNLPAISMRAFRESLDQKSDKAMKVGGKFSDPPSMDDLRTLELDDNAIEQLRECAVGKCGLNLPASAIARFQNSVDWNAADAKQRANDIFREIILADVQGYATRGDSALAAYDNQRAKLDLSEVHRAMLGNANLIAQVAPEFAAYLKQYPAANLPGVENSLHWSVIDFGLKPITTVSHAAAYTQTNGQTEQFFVASKQIYASRYLDASLTFTMLLRVAGADGPETYLLFLDRSRSSALGGAIGRFARGIVEQKAGERVATFIDKAHLRLLAAANPRMEESISTNRTVAHRLLNIARSRVTFLILASTIVGMLFFILWRRRRPRAHRSAVSV